MNRYYVNYPRDFANEYTVYVVDNDVDQTRLLALYPDADRITRKRAISLGITQINEARRTGQYLSGGFASDGYYLSPTPSDEIRAAVVGTRAHLVQHDADAEIDQLEW